MVIAWDEVVRDWRDMAPGLVFCDTSPCTFTHATTWGGGGFSGKGGKRTGRGGNIGLSMPCNMAILSNKLAECIQHIREAESHSFCRKINYTLVNITYALFLKQGEVWHEVNYKRWGFTLELSMPNGIAHAKCPWNCSIIWKWSTLPDDVLLVCILQDWSMFM